MSFVRRKIGVTFTLGTGSFGEGGQQANTVQLDGHRVIATIEKSGLPSFDRAMVRIYGLTESLMNTLSRLGKPLILARDNTIQVQAGDDTAGMAQIFQGTLQESWTDFDGQPDVCLHCQAHAAGFDAMKPVPALSYNGPVDVATIMSGLAARMGLKFENTGVVGVMLRDPYFPGTARAQAEACSRAVPFNLSIDTGVLAIWPKNGARGAKIPLVSPATGLVGYAGYCDTGITFRTLFNPNIVFGAKVKLETSLKPANGEWIINGVTHNLAAEQPNGPWFTNVKAYRFGDPATIVSS